MATVTNTKEIVLLAGFADEDDRTITVPNPIDEPTGAQIQALQTAAAGVIVGDKFGAAFTRFKSAKIRDTTRTKLAVT